MSSTPRDIISLLLMFLLQFAHAFRPVSVSSHTSRSFVQYRRYHRCAFSPRMVRTSDSSSQTQPDCTSFVAIPTVQVQAQFVPESKWRHEALVHKSRMESLLEPGLLQRHQNMPKNMKCGRALNPLHPIYNFLIEYYGLKGSKGVNRLLRWCPDPFYYHNKTEKDKTIQLDVSFPIESEQELSLISQSSHLVLSGVFLENASMRDVNSGILNLKGATFIVSPSQHDHVNHPQGILYSPQLYFGRKDVDLVWNDSTSQTPHKAGSAFLWYRTLLRNTLKSDPILYCHGKTNKVRLLSVVAVL